MRPHDDSPERSEKSTEPRRGSRISLGDRALANADRIHARIADSTPGRVACGQERAPELVRLARKKIEFELHGRDRVKARPGEARMTLG